MTPGVISFLGVSSRVLRRYVIGTSRLASTVAVPENIRGAFQPGRRHGDTGRGRHNAISVCSRNNARAGHSDEAHRARFSTLLKGVQGFEIMRYILILGMAWCAAAQGQYDLLLKGGHVIDNKNGISAV